MLRENKYLKGWFCAKCNSKLTHNELCYMGGVCPECGNISGTSIIDHNVRARRWIDTSSGWLFWRKNGYYEFADNLVTIRVPGINSVPTLFEEAPCE